MIRIQVPARAGVLGNPSDGFFGKTLGIPVRNFHAEVVLFEWERIEILPGPSDHVTFASLEAMIEDIETHGYYGGVRLIKAAVCQFYRYVTKKKLKIADKRFTIRYTSTIPRQVGLAGSSAIIAATMKALGRFYQVSISQEIMANLVLWSETEELGLSAGLQDRVLQVYDQPVFMNFAQEFMERHGYGQYTPVDPQLFPPMYLAYRTKLTHKEHVHSDVTKRWQAGDKLARETMSQIAENAQVGYEALQKKDCKQFDKCLNRNFDLRAKIYPIPEENLKMIQLARSLGATAKFPGSGGAVMGTYPDAKTFAHLRQAFSKIGCQIVKIKL
jgi:glucuronokinase